MTFRDYLLSAACGVGWQVIVNLLLYECLSSLDFYLLAGAAAGVFAGALTIRSRKRRDGRESWLNLAFTYFAAVAVYAFVGNCLDWPPQFFGSLAFSLFYGMVYAVVWAVVLVPLSYVTRRLVWWAHQLQLADPKGVQTS
ncbi:MAG: hypothetical protein NXI31_22220 [bacterium]|nr:hypothetical protein [bacterium]